MRFMITQALLAALAPAILLALLCAHPRPVAAQTLAQVLTLSRHGVREPRDVSSFESGAQLLDSAYDRLYLKGQGLRSLYPDLLASTWKPTELWANSSSWARTQQTAHGTLAGLFPAMNNVTRQIPVFSSPWEFDATLYNYDKCPAYDAAWAAFQTGADFVAKQAVYSNLLTSLNRLIQPATPITLGNIFSTWDLYWIMRNRPEVGSLAPNIDDATYAELTAAATYTETTRYSARVAGDFLGATTLAAIKYRHDMMRSTAPAANQFKHKWILMSGHYATQLDLLAALNYTGPASRQIPDYNSVLVFELWSGAATPSGWGIKLSYFDGQWPTDGSHAPKIPIALGDCPEGDTCMYDADVFWTQYASLKNLQQFCQDCGSTLRMCAGANPASSGSSSVPDKIGAAVAAAPVSLLLNAVATLMALLLARSA